MLSQVQECFGGLDLEIFIVLLIHTSHTQNHWLVDSDWRYEKSLVRWIFTQDKTEIHMEHIAVLCDH